MQPRNNPLKTGRRRLGASNKAPARSNLREAVELPPAKTKNRKRTALDVKAQARRLGYRRGQNSGAEAAEPNAARERVSPRTPQRQAQTGSASFQTRGAADGPLIRPASRGRPRARVYRRVNLERPDGATRLRPSIR